MPTKAQAENKARLKRMHAGAKAYMRKHPNSKYSTALKEAGRKERGKKVSGIPRKKRSGLKKRKPAKASRPKRSRASVGTKPKYKVVHEVRRISGISYKGGSIKLAGVGNVETQKKQLRAALGEQLGWLDVAISQARTAREKTALRKMRSAKVSELNRIK